MAEILTDLSTHSLVCAIQQNLYDLIWDLRDHWKQATFEGSEKLCRWWSPIPFAFIFNAALSLQPPHGDETALIEETIDFFRTRQRGAFDWWFSPELDIRAWSSQMEAHGLTLNQDPPGMAVDLATLPETLPQPAGMRIEVAEDLNRMEAWTKTFISGYGLPPDWAPYLLDMMLATLHHPVTSYLAWVDGQPVATATICYAAGVAGIYNIATLPEYRGRGIGAAITLLPLLDARRKGYRAGILQSSEMGYTVYQRLGFKELCKLSHYHWEAPSGAAG